MQFRRPFIFVALLFVSITVPASAHDLPMGGSRWRFGQNDILGFIDLKSPLFSEIKPIKEGHYATDSASAEQLQQLANVIQPYVSQKLSITVNDKVYPVKVIKIEKNADNLYTIWLAADHVSFNKPVNDIKIVYSLLFDETKNEHLNLAFGYVTDASGSALQKVFDFTPPAFQTTFDSKDTVWEISVKGATVAATTALKAESPVAKSSLGAVEHSAAQKSAPSNPPASLSIREDTTHKRNPDDGPVASSIPSVREASSDNKENHPVEPTAVSPNTAKWSIWTTFRQFVPLGIEHILTGYDHIAFLLAIIVIELSIRQILKIITAFTVAHSITLLLAALDIVRLNSRFVESAIALSICYVAFENVFKKKVDYRWVITFGFGLIHGFGFASALGSLIVGKANLLLSVLCFNMGVEIGQLMLICALLPILYLLKKQIGFRTVTVGTSACVFVIGFTWLIERVFQLKMLWF